MSGLYIPNMNYPKVGEVICVFPNGKVQKRIVELSTLYEVTETSESIPVLPHGRLIDADEFYKDINESILLTDGFKDAFNLWFDEQPTIIEADKEDGE